MEEKFKLYNKDSYELINKFIKDGVKVDHIITDPPYNISKDNNFKTMKCCKTGIDFGQWDRGEFDLCAWIPKYAQLLNPNGCMVIFCSYLYISDIIRALKASDMAPKDVIVWQKPNPFPRNVERRYVQDMEFAIWAVKNGAKWVFHKDPDVPYMRSLYRFPVVRGKEKLGHPTQKSLALMKELIKVHTNPNDLILDPFMGSGSTGHAALELGRRFIGVEREKEFFDMAKNRLEKLKLD